MAPDATADATSLSTARITVPQHVVYRSFPSETVVLNLQTGKYHGLNATAGRMLEALEQAPCLRDAAASVALEYQLPAEGVESDMRALCSMLLDRGLVEIDDPPAG
jgi:hypothetical protein